MGLHPDANLEIVGDAFAKRKKWELQMANSEILEFKKLQHRAPSIPTLEPQVDCMTKFFPGTILYFFYFQQYMIRSTGSFYLSHICIQVLLKKSILTSYLLCCFITCLI